MMLFRKSSKLKQFMCGGVVEAFGEPAARHQDWPAQWCGRVGDGTWGSGELWESVISSCFRFS